MSRSRATTLVPSLVALVGILALAGCSGETTTPSAPEGSAAPPTQEASGGDFCSDYRAAGGTLATPGLFQVALPAQTTIDDLSQRVTILDAATPPGEIATQWTTVRDLYTEVIGIAEQIPAEETLVDSRIFEIVDELSAPTGEITDYLDANC